MLPIEKFEQTMMRVNDAIKMPMTKADREKAEADLREAWNLFLHVHDSEQAAIKEIERRNAKENKKKSRMFSFIFSFGFGRSA